MKIKKEYFYEETTRLSMPNILRSSFIYELYNDEPLFPEETLNQRINRKLMKYKEIRILYRKTHIEPSYYLLFLLVILVIIAIGLFDKQLTIILATVYPLYMSYKTLQFNIGEKKGGGGFYTEEENKKDIIRWLCYWIFYSIFINFEGLFYFFLKYIKYYFTIKIFILLLCFLPQYQLSGFIYRCFIRYLFYKYEKIILGYSILIFEKLSKTEKELRNRTKTFSNKHVPLELSKETPKDFEKFLFKRKFSEALDKKLNEISECNGRRSYKFDYYDL